MFSHSSNLRALMLAAASCVVSLVACGGCGGNSDSQAPANNATGGTAGAAGATSAAGAAGEAQGGTSAAGAAGASAGAAAGPTPNAAFIPKPKGTCPDFKEGKITVAPGGKARDVQIWISDAAKTLEGPLVFYWHGTGSSPVIEPPAGIGKDQIAAIKALGGIVAAPFHDPAAGTFPWFLTGGTGAEDDIVVADEIVACAIEKVGIDLRRIHTMGMSAGGLQTVQLSYRRSGYIASSVVYSGGQYLMPPNQDPSNKFASMIFWGGKTDCYGQYCFDVPTNAYKKSLVDTNHFNFLCDHGGGHAIPYKDVAASWRFLSDHPFGTDPSPYANALPPEMPTYCAL